jgi:hypothetical protein
MRAHHADFRSTALNEANRELQCNLASAQRALMASQTAQKLFLEIATENL